jgi:hypothetical protein
MKAEKKAQLRSRSDGKKIGETVKTINIINLVVICGGFGLYLLNINETATRIGQALVFAGAFAVILTIMFQLMMASKMKKGK